MINGTATAPAYMTSTCWSASGTSFGSGSIRSTGCGPVPTRPALASMRPDIGNSLFSLVPGGPGRAAGCDAGTIG